MKAEPVAVAVIVAALVNAVVLLVFGRTLEKEEEAAIIGVVTAVAGLWARSKVSPTGG